MKKTPAISRRKFLGGIAATGAFNIIPANVLWGANAPSNQLTRALIGFGAIAHSANHLPYKGSRLVGMTEVDQVRLQEGLGAAAANGWGKIKSYKNFMELIDDPGVDIVHICTPPHWHGCMSVMAARAGKDIWCEKPMTRTVGEGLRVRNYIREKKRMFRINTWFRYEGQYYGFGTTVRPIRKVVENHLVASPGSPIRCVFGEGQGFKWKFHISGRVNSMPEPCPSTFDWDLWLGPAPWKPFNKHRTHEYFRGYWDYDAGGLGDMAQHYLDPLQYLLCKDEESPVKVDYVGPKHHPEVVGRFDRITLTYADGTEVILDGNGTLKNEPFLTGDRGTVWPRDPATFTGCDYYTRTDTGVFRMRDANGKALDVASLLKELPEPPHQITDFMESVRTRQPFCLNESSSFRSATMFNIAIAAERLGRGFRFDPNTFRAVDDEAANRFLYQSMRDPWHTEMYKA